MCSVYSCTSMKQFVFLMDFNDSCILRTWHLRQHQLSVGSQNHEPSDIHNFLKPTLLGVQSEDIKKLSSEELHWPSKHLSESNRMYNTCQFINLQYHSTKTKKAPHAKSSMFILCSSPYVGERLQSQNGAFSNMRYRAAMASTCLPGCHCIDRPENLEEASMGQVTEPPALAETTRFLLTLLLNKAMECYPKFVDHWPTMKAQAGFLRQQMDTNGPSMSHVALLQTHLLGQRANQITVGNHYLPQTLSWP